MDILNGLDIKSFNDEFYLEWKTIDWKKTFDDQYFGGFLPKVANFINNLQDFNILFKLFDISKDNNQQDFNHYSLTTMQTKFVELIKNCDPNNCPNYDDDLIKLLFYSDQRKANIEDFLTTYLQNILSVKRINEIYIKFLSIYKEIITPNSKSIITNFFTKNPSNSNPDSLLYFIKNCPELSQNILKSIDKIQIIQGIA